MICNILLFSLGIMMSISMMFGFGFLDSFLVVELITITAMAFFGCLMIGLVFYIGLLPFMLLTF